MPGVTDNYPGNLGSGGETYASDSISSVHHPRVKIGWGVDGVFTDASATNPVPVTVASTVAVADVTTTGTLAAAAQTVALSVVGGMSAAAIQITGTWVGTIQFEGTVDGATWVPINGVFAGGTAPGPTITANGVVRLTPSGLTSFRANMTAWTSGTATITVRAGQGTGGTFLNQSLPIGTNVIGKFSIDQATPGTTNAVQFTNTTLAVTGAFFQATQPVSGTFFQATQPVSIASMPSTPVTGTFFQATQPVSMTSTTITGAVAVTQATITKGTQGAQGVTTQDLHNAGRAFLNASTAIAGVTAVTAEALLTLNVSRDAATVAAVTTIAVTATKRLRITGLSVGLISTGASVLSGRFSLRVNPAGAAAATSPILVIIPVPSGAALAQAGGSATIMFAEAIELSGTMQCGITQVCSAATGTVWASLIGYEY